MSVSSVLAPYPIFADADGVPIENGKVYIGTVNLNPVTNPITVYWDSAATIPAAQPIRTIGGYPSRNGTPSKLYINADDCSISLYDQIGRLVYYEPSVLSISSLRTDLAASTGSGLIGWIQAGAGTVFRFVQDKLRESVSIKDFGSTIDGSTNDSTTNQSAINALGAPGGEVLSTPGTTNISTIGLTLPASANWSGKGKRSSIISYSGTGYAATLGGTASSLYYGCGIRDSQILLTARSGKGVLAQGTAGANIRNLYIEGPSPVGAGDSTIGVAIDGSNASAFFNTLDSIHCNHIKTGFKITGPTSATNATTQMLSNCQAFGDVVAVPGNGSIGLLVTESNGNGTVVSGGNFEQCQTGVMIEGGGTSISMFGTRFEANTTDINLNLFSYGSAFFGLKNLNNVTDNSGTGFGRHMFWGCMKEDGTPYPNIAYGQTRFLASTAAEVALTVRAYGSQTANIQEWKTSSGDVPTAIQASGDFWGRDHVLIGGSAPTQYAGNAHLQILDQGGTGCISLRRSTATAGHFRKIDASDSNTLNVLDHNDVGVTLAEGATAWAATSDERMKDIIEPIKSGLDKVSSLRSVIGKYKTDPDGARRAFLIAQDVQKILPEAVITDQKTGILSVAYTDLIPLLVSAIRELKEEIDVLKTVSK